MLFTRHDPDDTIHGKNHIINHNPNPIYAAIVIIFTPKYVAGGGLGWLCLLNTFIEGD